MQHSPIEWTDFTANPLKYRDADGKIVWACIHASPGCQKCYSEALAHRYKKGGPFNVATMEPLTPFMDDTELQHMLTYKPASGKRCFVGDMTDLFGDWVSFELLDRLFAVFALRPDVTWQVLTKRAERMRQYLYDSGLGTRIGAQLMALARGHVGAEIATIDIAHKLTFRGLPNVHLGVSVESQPYATRLYDLARTPAAIRFCSYEPALGPVNFRRIEVKPGLFWDAMTGAHEARLDSGHIPLPGKLPGLDWLIVGGESGRGARPMNIAWARSAKEQCSILTGFFMKQFGAMPYEAPEGVTPSTSGPDAAKCRLVELDIDKSHGGDPVEWPEDLRVRQFPEPRP